MSIGTRLQFPIPSRCCWGGWFGGVFSQMSPPQWIGGFFAEMGTIGEVSGSSSRTLINGWDRLLRNALRSRLQSNRPPSCVGHASGNISALGRQPAVTVNPGPSVWGVLAIWPPRRTCCSQLLFIRWKLPLQPRILWCVGTESKQPKTRAASGNHKFLASYSQASEILLIPHFWENI